MVKWQGYCSSENTWEPKPHLPPELIETFESPEHDPVCVDETGERIALVLERGMKVFLQHEESIEIRHDVVRFLLPNLPAQIRLKPAEISDQELEDAGLGLYVEWKINASESRC